MGEMVVDERLVQAAGKLVLLDRMLTELHASGHKTLIFCQMTKMMDILEDYLEMRRWACHRIDGMVPWSERQALMDSYNGGSLDEAFVFLLSTRAGGLGINLVSADTVIIYDGDFNPQQDLQAMDRCHRIGQTKPVTVVRLLTVGSIETRIFERASNKRKLELVAIARKRFKVRRRRACGRQQPAAAALPGWLEQAAPSICRRVAARDGGGKAGGVIGTCRWAGVGQDGARGRHFGPAAGRRRGCWRQGQAVVEKEPDRRAAGSPRPAPVHPRVIASVPPASLPRRGAAAARWSTSRACALPGGSAWEAWEGWLSDVSCLVACLLQSLSASELSDLLTPKPLDEVNKDIISDKDLSKLLLHREQHEVCRIGPARSCQCCMMDAASARFSPRHALVQAVERDGKGWQYLVSKES
jgi:hypothetical protein